MKWLSRFATPVVQRAHARVTAENAVYVAEAIKADAKIARLTQERDRYKAVADELRRKQERQMELTAERIEELDLLRVQVQDLADQLADATGPNPLTADNDRLARELNLSKQSAVSIAQTARAQVDAAKAETARLQRRWDGHAAVCPVASAVEQEDTAKRASDL